MEIEVGEYVRTKRGNIGIFKGYNRNLNSPWSCKVDLQRIKTWQYITEEYITKHSKNITDLIEDKDIVEIEYFSKYKNKRITRKFETTKIDKVLKFCNIFCSFIYDLSENKWIDGKGHNPKIKTILTHEQFEKNAYRLEEK